MTEEILFSTAYNAFVIAKRSERLSRNYEVALRQVQNYFILRLGDLPITHFTPTHLRQWLLWLGGQDADPAAPPAPNKGKGLQTSSLRTFHQNIHAFFKWCELEEIIPHSPMQKVKRPKPEEKIPTMVRPTEAHSLIVKLARDKSNYKDLVLFEFLIETGLRRAELCNMNVDDVNLDEGYCIVKRGKGKKDRLIPLSLTMCRSLNRYLLKHRRAAKKETALFVNPNGFQFTPANMSNHLRKIIMQYIPRTMNRRGAHAFRHLSLTIRAAEGDMYNTAKIAGHSDMQTTRRYDHLLLKPGAASPLEKIYSQENLIISLHEDCPPQGESGE